MLLQREIRDGQCKYETGMARHAISQGRDKPEQNQHRLLNFLDLDITVQYSPESADFDFKAYCKPETVSDGLRVPALRILPHKTRL
jgi:hypothetical protein